jgi:hypothetical protein
MGELNPDEMRELDWSVQQLRVANGIAANIFRTRTGVSYCATADKVFHRACVSWLDYDGNITVTFIEGENDLTPIQFGSLRNQIVQEYKASCPA